MTFAKIRWCVVMALWFVLPFGYGSALSDTGVKLPKLDLHDMRLENGLRVILVPDHSAPVYAINVSYNVGSRNELPGHTGFAHLFEHMMFEGSANAPKGTHFKMIESNGGSMNGSTHPDYTDYFEVLPANKLETALWAEADRMGGLAVTEENLKNQQGVVGNEVKVNVLNRPYGGFPWLDMPQYANTNWFNAHNFYGDLKDIEAATLADVQAFFKTYYAPNNAALAIVGDFDPAEAKKFVEKYFGPLKTSDLPGQPDLTEPRQEKEKHATKIDTLAKRPAIALGYHMPERNTPEYFAMTLIDEMLIEGDDSLLHQELVQKRGITGNVNGGINQLGTPWDYKGPMLFITNFIYDPATSPETIVQAIDGAIEPLRTQPVDQKTLDRAKVKVRSELYDAVGQFSGFGLVDLLASFALFDDDPGRVNTLASEYQKVTPELIQKTAQEYLRPENRTVLLVQPPQQAPAAAPAAPVKNQ